MFGLNEFVLAIALGCIFFALFILVFIFERIWFKLYGFINDSKEVEHSKIIRYLCLRKGYTDRVSSCYWFDTPGGGISDGTGSFFQCALLFLASPIVLLIAFKLYALSLFILSSIALLYLARFAFRAKKVMSKHISNEAIHNKG